MSHIIITVFFEKGYTFCATVLMALIQSIYSILEIIDLSRGEKGKRKRKEKKSGEAAFCFSLPFVTQKEVGVGAKPQEVENYNPKEAAKLRFERFA